MTNPQLEALDDDSLTQANGGTWDDLVNVGRAAANGGVNALNFFHDHPTSVGPLGTFSVGGDRIEKPFKNDPLSHVGVVQGHAVPARSARSTKHK